MFNKILVAIDSSTISRDVFEAGISLAKKTGANLMLLHVLCSKEQNYLTPPIHSNLEYNSLDSSILDVYQDNPTPLIYSGLEYDWYDSSILDIYQRQWQKFEQQRLELLRSLTEEALNTGVNTEFTQTWGNPGDNICDLAQTWSADLILIGSRGLTGVKEMFLGSVSNYVTHHAPCSVLIWRGTADLESKSSQHEQGEFSSSGL